MEPFKINVVKNVRVEEKPDIYGDMTISVVYDHLEEIVEQNYIDCQNFKFEGEGGHYRGDALKACFSIAEHLVPDVDTAMVVEPEAVMTWEYIVTTAAAKEWVTELRKILAELQRKREIVIKGGTVKVYGIYIECRTIFRNKEQYYVTMLTKMEQFINLLEYIAKYNYAIYWNNGY